MARLLAVLLWTSIFITLISGILHMALSDSWLRLKQDLSVVWADYKVLFFIAIGAGVLVGAALFSG